MSYRPRTKKPERLFQRRFDESSTLKTQEVTPPGFKGLGVYPRQEEGLLPAASGNELGRFVREVREEVVVNSPRVAAKYLMERVFIPFDQFDQEELWVLLLNNKNRITHAAMVYRGTINSVLVRPAEILKEAVRVNAPMVIMSHCHPSGSPEASPEDIGISRQVHQAAQMLGIDLLDHIIVGKNRWASLKERGYYEPTNRKD